MFENIIEQGIKYLKEELFPRITEEIAPQVYEGAKKTGKEIIAAIVPIIIKMKEQGETENIVVETFEMLNKERLITVAKNNVVDGSDGIAAYMLEKDDMVYVYLANVKDCELLPQKDNKFVIIKAECVKNEIKTLFGEDELIILK